MSEPIPGSEPSTKPPTSEPARAPAGASPRLVTVNAVNWGNIVDFLHLFRGFRLAINPAKLAIALLAIMMIYAGGRLFDVIWGPQADRNAIRLYAAGRHMSVRGTSWESQRESAIDMLLGDNHDLTPDQRASLKSSPRAARKAMKNYYYAEFEKSLKASAELRAAAASAPSGAVITTAEQERQSQAAAARVLQDRMRRLDDTIGHGIFETFLEYETDQFDALIENTLTFVRLSPVRVDGVNAGSTDAVSGGLISRDLDRLWRSDTVAGCIANMAITGPCWLFTAAGPMSYRPADADTSWGAWLGMVGWRALYLATLLVLAVLSLLALAFAGASISRLSALELAGIERAPLKDVFVFAARRLWVFIKAPLAPFLILLAFGLVMTLLGMVGAIPFVGPILFGALLFVFLGISFILMLLCLGILGGFNLFYPTIAVEGADAFDAMSRSFAYAYARPWRLIFYTVTALVYGALTFLFVCFAVYLIFMLTHTFAGWGMNLFGIRHGAYSGLPLLETIWPEPRFLELVQPINWHAMSWPEYLGGILLYFWIFLLITGIGAYVVSYYFSTHTIIYLLLRRSVDGQNLREIHLE